MAHRDVKALADKYFYDQCLRLGPIGEMPPDPYEDRFILTFEESVDHSIIETLQVWFDAVNTPSVTPFGSCETLPADQYYIPMTFRYDLAVDNEGDCV